ncbi:MAG: MBL fold metallo-hydrolase [Candidatus Brocadiaceae bacterium]|nr:MBL fold metallo-hydrolase [Candidatus Brocadiaceae bacterium]
MQQEQYVCAVCGFNMVGYYPEKCPFCGATRGHFITSQECSSRFRVKGFPVNEKVTRLNSVPPLGLEHSAYRIETKNKSYWIDCPSSFDSALQPVDVITFTHHHFLGASNLYREHFSSRVRIHKLDAVHKICEAFAFDEMFVENFSEDGIDAFHVDGHTPGFTFYIFGDVLLICDYVFLKGEEMKFNPYGPERNTREGGKKIQGIIGNRKIAIVCGFNYVVDYAGWKVRFDALCV